MPWPRDDATRWRCLEATADNSVMTVEKAEAIRNPTAQAKPKEKAKEKPVIAKKEAVENKPVMHLRTIFNDADDNPTTYLKITMLERRLTLKSVTKGEFQE